MKIKHFFVQILPIILFLLSIHQSIEAQSWKERSFNGAPRDVIFTQLFDWDQDGDLDIIGLERSHEGLITNDNQNWKDQLVWYENEPSYQFKPRVILTHYLENAVNFEIADFDHDGKVDILLVSNGITWFQHQANGTFIQWTIKANRAVKSSQVIDFNGDGYMDLIASFSDGLADDKRTALFINDTKGQFKEIAVPKAKNLHQIQVGDVNKDGLLDIVGLYERGPKAFQLLYGKNNFDFPESIEINFNDDDGVFSFRLKDYNLDGNLDIVILTLPPGAKALVLDGSQNFKFNPSFKISPKFDWSDSGAILTVDFDKNRVLDCLFTNLRKLGAIQIYHAENDHTQTVDQGFTSNVGPMMTTGDLDKDGDVDMICAVNDNSRTLFLWFENINGELYPHQISGKYEDIKTLKITDYDLDGDEDVLFSCAYFDPRAVCRNGLYLLENRGAGVYQNWYIASFHHEEESLQFEDLDLDDDLDVVVLSTKSKALNIYLNNRVPYGWTVQNVASNLGSAKEIRTFYTNDGAGILSWNTKLEVYLRNPDDGTYLPKSLFPSKGKILQAEMVDLGLDGRYHLAIHSQDSAQNQRLSIFRFSGDWNIEENYTLKEYKSLRIFPVRARAGAQALFFAAEKQGKVELFALKRGFRGYELNALYQFKYASQLYKSDRYYLFQTDDFLYFRDGDEVFKVNLKDPKSIEKEVLEGIKLELIHRFAVGESKDGDFHQLVGSMYDGYLSIFTKKP